MSKPVKTLLIWVLLIVMFFAIYQVLREPGAAGDASPLGTLLIVLGGVLLVVAAVVLLARRMQGGAQGLFGMRKSTARLLSEVPKVGFADVGGADEARERLGDVVDFLKNPERWRRAGARLPRGVLLEGPPGCGKTLLARALAGEAGVPFFEVSASEFVELFVGVGPARVRDLFEEAGKKAPCIVFVDELDAIGRRRGSASSALLHVEYEQTLNQLLVCMDGFRPTDRVVVVAATNRADVLDDALLRPGRFDLRLRLPPLTTEGRLAVLGIHTRSKPLAPGVDLRAIADAAEGLSGAELEHLANEAALSAARRARRESRDDVRLEAADFRAALDGRARAAQQGDPFDALLHESQAQAAKPRGRLDVRATLDDGAVVEGELLWASAQTLKLRGADGREVALSRASVRQIEALPAGERPSRDAAREAPRTSRVTVAS